MSRGVGGWGGGFWGIGAAFGAALAGLIFEECDELVFFGEGVFELPDALFLGENELVLGFEGGF